MQRVCTKIIGGGGGMAPPAPTTVPRPMQWSVTKRRGNLICKNT